MKKLVSLILMLTFGMGVMALPTSQDPKPETVNAPAPADGMVTLPDGTEIEIQLRTNASGEALKVGDIVDFVVGRILDQLRIEHSLIKRWAQDSISTSQ